MSYEYTTDIPLCVDINLVREHLNQVVSKLYWFANNPRKFDGKNFIYINESLAERTERVNNLEPTENSYDFSIQGNRALGRYAFSFDMKRVTKGRDENYKFSFLDLPAFIFDTDTNEIIPIDIDEL